MANSTVSTTDLVIVDSRPEDYDKLASNIDIDLFCLLRASTGDEALRLPRQSPLALWFINTRLPDMTGSELLSLVRHADRTAVCVLVGEAYSSTEEVAARQIGATMYVCKPPLVEWLRVWPAARPRVTAAHSAHGPPRVPPSQVARSGPIIPALRSGSAIERGPPRS